MDGTLFSIGAMFVLYVITRLLLMLYLHREDNGISNWFDRILAVIIIFLGFCSAPVCAISLFFTYMDIEWYKESTRDEQRAVYKEMLDSERKKAYNEGYEAGHRDGNCAAKEGSA